jgi:hypothetical protein
MDSFQTKFSSAKKHIQVYLDNFEGQLQELIQLELTDTATKDLASTNLSQQFNVVCFNVGGKVFKINKTAIEKFPFSLFYAILGSGKYPIPKGKFTQKS